MPFWLRSFIKSVASYQKQRSNFNLPSGNRSIWLNIILRKWIGYTVTKISRHWWTVIWFHSFNKIVDMTPVFSLSPFCVYWANHSATVTKRKMKWNWHHSKRYQCQIQSELWELHQYWYHFKASTVWKENDTATGYLWGQAFRPTTKIWAYQSNKSSEESLLHICARQDAVGSNNQKVDSVLSLSLFFILYSSCKVKYFKLFCFHFDDYGL